jgi:hypothetical protein
MDIVTVTNTDIHWFSPKVNLNNLPNLNLFSPGDDYFLVITGVGFGSALLLFGFGLFDEIDDFCGVWLSTMSGIPGTVPTKMFSLKW